MTAPYASAARIVAEARERANESGVEDGDPWLEGSLEGITDLPELMAAMAREMRWAKAQAVAVQTIIDDAKERLERYSFKADKLRAAIAWTLQEAGWKRIPADALPEMTVSLRKGQRPLITGNDDDVPGMFKRVKTITEVDKKALREWLEEGGEVSGWYLGNEQPVLTVR